MPISANDIRFYLSGGSSNQNPLNSLGGAISNTEIFNDVLENIFDNVTKVEADNGLTDYRCIYVKNIGNEIWKNATVFLQQQSLSEDDTVQFGVGTSAINGVEQTIPNDTTAPTGVNGSNSNTLNNGFLLGDLAPGSHKAIWLARGVDVGASTYKRNKFVLRIQMGNPAGGGGTTCPAGHHWDTTAQICVPDCPTGYHWDIPTQQCLPDVPGGGGGGGGGGGTQQPETDANGIIWYVAKGQQFLIEQSRHRVEGNVIDDRWSEVYSDLDAGFEVTAIALHDGAVYEDPHMSLKHWGGNHSGNCQYEEGGSCCCWYDTGIRDDGTIQTEIERPHPNNDSWACPECTMTNCGTAFNQGKYIGLKWLCYPLTYPGGNADNGGVKIKMWVDNDAINPTTGKPRNNWVLVYDIVDNPTRDILADYPAPSEQEIEMRISDVPDLTVYGGGLHMRRIRRPDDLLPPSGGGGGGTTPVCPSTYHWDAALGRCVSNTGGGGGTPVCPTGQHWDSTLQRCVVDTGGGGGGTPVPDFTMAQVGDTICGSATEDILSNIEARNVDILLHTGDHTHTSSVDCWFDMTNNFNDAGKIKQCSIGNHDDEEDETNSNRNDLLAEYNLSLPYHSFNFRNVHVLTLYTSSSYGYGSGSDQYEFARNDLQTARANPAIDWIIVLYHKAIYTVGNDHGAESSFRDLYHPLFDQFKVDLAINGHNHNYERSYPIRHGGGAVPVVVDTNAKIYADLVNPICITNGGGGRTLDDFSSKGAYSAIQHSSYGYLHLVWSNNGKKLTGRRYSRSDELQDEFVITKGQIDNNPPPTGGDSGTVGNDVFGIRKIYPTKASGDEFFYTSATDPRFGYGNATVLVQGGDTLVADPQPRLLIYTQGNNDGNLSEDDRGNSPPLQSHDFSELASTGYWYQARDWKNVEFTVYFSVDEILDDTEEELELVLRSVLHDNNVENGCGGSSYHCCINYVDGRVRFKKEENHAEYEIDNYTSTDIGNIGTGRWIGFKGVVFNRADGSVEMEIWVDKSNNNTWTKYHSKIDTGNWGDNMDGCGASSGGAKISWGSPICMIKWNENEMRLRYISVREITPPR